MDTPLRMGGAACKVLASAALISTIFLFGCGSGGNSSSAPPPTFTVGGTVSGLAGSGLVLQDNGGNNLAVSASGSFTFTTPLASGSTYSVTVFSQPSNVTQTCVPTTASGTVGSSNVNTVVVTCTTDSFTVGGNVSGLLGSGLVLQDNGANNLAVSGNGSFTFPVALASGTAYAVTASTEPASPAQVCNVTNGSGTVTSGTITTVSVSCVTTTTPTTALALADFNNNRVVIFNAPFSMDEAANVVLGEPDFVTSNVGTTAATMNNPAAIAEDRQGKNLYVAENGNCRVTQFVAPFTNGMSASVVFGQPDFVSNNNCGATSTITASSLGNTSGGSGGGGDNVFGVVVDASGNLWVADSGANRVLEYTPPFSNGMAATLAIGQANFTTGDTNQGGAGPTAASLSDPVPFFDLSGNLWVADFSNNRVLEFKPPFSTGMAASLVLGQADFTSNAANENGPIAANTLDTPNGGAFDASGNLWIADFSNNRVLEFTPPFVTNMSASLVLGQVDFIHGGANTTSATLTSPSHVSFDSSGNAFVVDENNNRTLMFTPPFITGMNASLVLGQSDFTSATSATTATGENTPTSAIPLPPPF